MSEKQIENSSEFREKERKPMVLEIGAGFKPYYEYLQNGSSNDINFVGLDIQKDWLKELKEKQPDISLVNANARLLPFRDETFDTVVLNSVLGGPDENWYAKYSLEQTNSDEGRLKKWDIQMEAYRVLKVGGRLKIFELFPLVDASGLYRDLEYLERQKKIIYKY